MTRHRNVFARRSAASTRVTRLHGIAVLAAFAFACVTLRAVQIHLFPDPRLSERLTERNQTVAAQNWRGSITDREGRRLVARGAADSLMLHPRLIEDPEFTARALADELGISSQRIRKRMQRDSPAFLLRWTDRETAARIQALDLPGVEIIEERRGRYPNGPLAAPFLGFAGYDELGRAGIELMFNVELSSPNPGEDPVRGRPLRGATVQLALDTRLQLVGEQALQRGLEMTGAVRGSLIVIDPRNGDVLVAAQAPGFHPRDYRETDPDQYRMRSFVDLFEPGSTLKPFVIAAALEAGAVRADDVFDCENGFLALPGGGVRDMRPHGSLTVGDCLALSSNICLAKIAEKLGSESLVSGLRSFSFGQSVDTKFPGTPRGVVHDLEPGQLVERANLSFGQGMQTSALQLALAGATLANGGRRVAPRIALAVHRGEESEEIEPRVGPRVISEGTADAVIAMMEAAVREGTGKAAALPFQRVAGKTGTAQKPDPDGQGYSDELVVASFLGIAPAQDPRLVVVVVLDEPQSPHNTGGSAAAPVFREFADYALRSEPQEPMIVAGGRHAEPRP